MEKKEVSSSEDGPEFDKLLQSLEQRTNWNGQMLFKYQGFWYLESMLRPTISCQKHFKAKKTDIILASLPKTGTTWLKSLTFAVATRHIFTIDQSPLLVSNPHNLVPFLEAGVWGQENPDQPQIPDPRIFSTHTPFEILPKSVQDCGCKIIYIWRNPLDNFVSLHSFMREYRHYKNENPTELDAVFDLFCQGFSVFGPFWDHVLGYWNAHLKYPEKVLFLRYEDLQENINHNVNAIAEFIGLPFSAEERRQGVVEQISSLCSFKNLSSLEVNKTGIFNANKGLALPNSSFFRKGEVGDWTNYLTPAMAKRMEKVVESKFKGSGLTFEW